VAPVALITGASGLIGRHVVARWAVPGVQLVPVGSADDLLLPGAPDRLVRRVRPTVVLHLAWTASGTPGYRDDERNAAWVAASLELARSCAETGAWFIGTGTAVDSAHDPPDAYSAAKVQLRRLLATAIDARDCSWLRPYYVVDPDQRRPALVADALRARESGDVLVLRTPDSRHDFVHAADVADAAQTVVRHHLGGEVPVGSGVARPVTDLVRALGAAWEPAPMLAQIAQPSPTSTPAQHHEAADVRMLRDHGWTPSRTKEMFQSA
jgi:nucleoside-diphosphate-sugar epimerase